MIVGAGLSLIVKMAGDIRSCAERLFEYPEIAPLDEDGARRALVELTIESQFELMEEVVDAVVERTKGYSYFLQECEVIKHGITPPNRQLHSLTSERQASWR